MANNTGEPGSYDIIVLGGGSGGYACALRAAQLDMSVAVVERDKLGGTCLHYGCIPTKAMLHAAEVADTARDAAQFGVNASLDGIDLKAVHTYKDDVVSRHYKGLQGLVKARKVTVLEGSGRLVAPNAVEVDGTRHEARHVVLATGSAPKTLPGLDIDGERIITSKEALALDRIPASVVVLGGGVIGVEFASIWRSFGAEVTIIEALDHLVPNEDEDVSKGLERAFRKRGISFRTGARFKEAERAGDGVRVTLESGDVVEAEVLLVAVGRGAATEGLGFEEAGVRTDRGYVPTDDRLRTNVPGVYALGDIVPGLQLAHRGFQQGIFVAEDIAGLDPFPIEESGIPRVTYCEPEVASVGLSEAAAKDRFGADAVSAYRFDLAANGKSHILKTQGFVKVVRQADGPVVGVHMVGSRVSELVGEAQLIYNWEALPAEVAQLVHAHPTQTEALGEAHLALAGKPLHVHG